MYKVCHLFVCKPRLYAWSVSGIISEFTSASKTTLSVSLSPNWIVPSAVMFPSAWRLPSTLRSLNCTVEFCDVKSRLLLLCVVVILLSLINISCVCTSAEIIFVTLPPPNFNGPNTDFISLFDTQDGYISLW